MIRGRTGSFVTGVIAIYSPFHSVSVSRFTVGGANFFLKVTQPSILGWSIWIVRVCVFRKKKRGGPPPHLFQTVPSCWWLLICDFGMKLWAKQETTTPVLPDPIQAALVSWLEEESACEHVRAFDMLFACQIRYFDLSRCWAILAYLICLSIRSIRLCFIYLSVCLSISPYLFVYLPAYHIYFLHLSTYLSTILSIYLSTYLPTYLSIYLSICPSIPFNLI